MAIEKHQVGLFPTTHWSEIDRIALVDIACEPDSLGSLLSRYLPALKYFLVRSDYCTPDAAEDLLQGFVLDRVILGRLIAKADRHRGKFRTLLLAALKNYAANVRRRRRAPDEAQPIADELTHLASTGAVHHNAYEIAWAKQLVSEALKLMEQKCRDTGRMDIWSVFLLRVVHPIYNNSKPPSYQQIVRQFRLDSPAQACNVVTTGKRMYTRILRSLIAEYVQEHKLVDNELNDLRKILASARA